jgi:hypothetical protein
MRAIAVLSVALAALSVIPVAVSAQDKQVGDFLVRVTRDKVTNADRSLAATTAAPVGDQAAALVWRCREDGLNVMYLLRKPFVGDERVEVGVMYKFDAATATPPTRWGLMDNNIAAFMMVKDVPAFTRAALAASQVTIQANDKDGTQLIDTFKLGGLSVALQALSCYVK